MYKIKIIEFQNWKEYEDIINTLASAGWIIDETLSKGHFRPLESNQHTVRLKKKEQII